MLHATIFQLEGEKQHVMQKCREEKEFNIIERVKFEHLENRFSSLKTMSKTVQEDLLKDFSFKMATAELEKKELEQKVQEGNAMKQIEKEKVGSLQILVKKLEGNNHNLKEEAYTRM